MVFPRRYEFHREGGVSWSLVFDFRTGLWHIEKTGERGGAVRMSLDEFENRKHGRGLSALHTVTLDFAET
jgi:hypothetical protein